MKNVYFFQEGIGTLHGERDICEERIIYLGCIWGGGWQCIWENGKYLEWGQSLFKAYAHVMCGAIVLLLKIKDNNWRIDCVLLCHSTLYKIMSWRLCFVPRGSVLYSSALIHWSTIARKNENILFVQVNHNCFSSTKWWTTF